MNFVVFVEIVVIFLSWPSMSGCKNVTRAPNSPLEPVSKTGLPTGAVVGIPIDGHRVKIRGDQRLSGNHSRFSACFPAEAVCYH